MNIQKLSDNKRKVIATLHRKKGRDQHEHVLIEGVRSVESAILGKATILQIVTLPHLLEDHTLQPLFEQAGAPVFIMNDKQAKTISSVENGQGILAVAEQKKDSFENLLLKESILVLDEIRDPGNVGTIIRTAAWFGIQGILAGPGTVDIYHPKTVRATMGGLWDIDCVKSSNLLSNLRKLKQLGFTVYGTYLNGAPLQQWKPQGRTALIIGSEAKGISDEVTGAVDERITIPGQGGGATESLNAATSASICMYQWHLARSGK